MFIGKGLIHLIDIISRKWRAPVEICDQVGFRSVRMVKQLIGSLKAAFPSQVLQFVNCFLSGGSTQCSFPKLFVSPRVCTEGDQDV